MPAGRHSKLTPECQKTIINFLRQGNYQCVAAEAAGVHVSTFNRWLVEGEEAKSGKKREFYEAVKKAIAEAEARHVQNVDHHAFGKDAKYDDKNNKLRDAISSQWQPSMTFLERKHPDRWARITKHEGGDPEKPITFSLTDKIMKMSNKELKSEIERIEKILEGTEEGKQEEG